MKVAHWDERIGGGAPVSCIRCANLGQVGLPRRKRPAAKRPLQEDDEEENREPVERKRKSVDSEPTWDPKAEAVQEPEEEEEEDVQSEVGVRRGKEEGEVPLESSSSPLTCKFCPRTFPSEGQLLQHEVYDELRLKGNRHCVFCAVPFETAASLHDHAREAHGKFKEMPCPACQGRECNEATGRGEEGGGNRKLDQGLLKNFLSLSSYNFYCKDFFPDF